MSARPLSITLLIPLGLLPLLGSVFQELEGLRGEGRGKHAQTEK